MKTKLAVLLVGSGAAWLTGCSSVVSLNPFVADGATIVDSSIVGLWESGDEEKAVIAVRQNGPVYSIVYTTDKSNTATKFEGRMFQVGDAKLLDVVAVDEQVLQVPVHALVRVWQEGDTLRWTFLDSDFVKEKMAGLGGQAIGSGRLVTAATPVIGKAVATIASDERAYEKAQVLRRAGRE